MIKDVRNICESALKKAVKTISPKKNQEISLEIPKDNANGDLSSNIALKLARELKKSPIDIAKQIKEKLDIGKSLSCFSKIEVKPPGFINFFLGSTFLSETLKSVLTLEDQFGSSELGKSKSIQIEFVSANPTGPLSVAHARQAAVGDALGNILKHIGYKVTKEYYVNDEGNQINILGASIKARALQNFTDISLSEEMYQGEYVKDIADKFIKDNSIKNEKDLEGKDEKITLFGVKYLLDVIKKELQDFGVVFDVWSFQSKIATQEKIVSTLGYLEKKDYIYEQDGAQWFKSTDFGDDKPRVVKKSDGTFTYLAPDIVYHKNKFDRKFSKVVNIWGPDHHGYIPRIKAAVEALGHSRDSIEVKIVQLATIYRNGQPVSMSTRRGQFITLREVIDDVGTDVARFFFLMRRVEAHLDFDLELAKKDAPENPVFYVQYAHARISSIKRKSELKNINLKKINLELLNQPEELVLIKLMGQFSVALENCAAALDPYGLISYLQEFATAFHSFYDKYKVISDDSSLTDARLALVEAVRIVLARGLSLLGISVPEKM